MSNIEDKRTGSSHENFIAHFERDKVLKKENLKRGIPPCRRFIPYCRFDALRNLLSNEARISLMERANFAMRIAALCAELYFGASQEQAVPVPVTACGIND